MENQFDNMPGNNINSSPNNDSDYNLNSNTDGSANGYTNQYQNMYQNSGQNGNPYSGGQQYQQPNNGYNQNGGYNPNNGYNQNYYVPNNGYQQNYNNPNSGMDTNPMTVGDWLLTSLALMIPCAGIILYFVWAFGSHGNINRRNYCRAQLIMLGIVLALYIIVVIILGVSFAGAMSTH